VTDTDIYVNKTSTHWTKVKSMSDLGKILNGVDVMMWWWTDQAYSWYCTSSLCYIFCHLHTQSHSFTHLLT